MRNYKEEKKSFTVTSQISDFLNILHTIRIAILSLVTGVRE